MIERCREKLKEEGQSEGSCFIATATYRNDNHPNVVVFREFRDKTLLKNYLGKIFVRVYYNLSPNLAKFIEKNIIARNISLTILNKIVEFLKK